MHNEFNILYADDDDQKTLAEELSGGVRYVYVALRYVTATITLGLRYSYNYDDRFLLLRLLCLRNTGSVGLIMCMCVYVLG